MDNQELIDWIAHSTDALADQIRIAFQPIVDTFVQFAADWNNEPLHERRHIMRRKVRRLLRGRQ